MTAPPYDYIAKICVLGDSSCGKSSLTVRLCEQRFSSSHDVTIGVEFNSVILPVGPPASLSLGINNPGTEATPDPTNIEEEPSQVDARRKATPRTRSTKSSLPEPPRSKASQKPVKLSLWDTAGQEQYKSITRSYFRGASGALLVFDISRRNTFENVTQWLHDLRMLAEEDIVVILVGNKSDLAGASLVDGPDGASTQKNKRAVTQAEAKEWCKRNGVLQYVETSAKSGEGVERAFLEVAERIYQNIEAGKYDLNDRRSGVKGPGIARGPRRDGNRAGGEIVLGVNEVGGMSRDGKKGWGGGCC